MTPVSDYWLKLYCEILDDPKMGCLSDHLWRRSVELMLAAKRLGKDGLLPTAEQIAWMLRLSDVAQLQSDLEAIATTGIIRPEGEGWLIVNFASRQGPSTSSERKRAQRDRKRSMQYDGISPLALGGRGAGGEGQAGGSTPAPFGAPVPFGAPAPSGVPAPDRVQASAGPGATAAPPARDPAREAAAAAKKLTQITPEERAWLNTIVDAFGEKFANPTQIRTALKIRAQFGEEKGMEAITYYANKGRPMGEGLSRALRALPKWGTFQDRPPSSSSSSASPAPASQPSPEQLLAELEAK